MILWIRGARKSGKTTLAKELAWKMDAIHLDGDDIRASISKDLSFSEEDRTENNERIARLAKILENQGFDVVISTICPDYVKESVFYITGCRFIEL